MPLRNQNGKSYYYRNRRVGGQVKTEYVGSGQIALYASILDKQEREQKAAEREREDRIFAAMSAEVEESERELDELAEKAAKVVEAYYLTHGYQKRHRMWKRRGNGK